MSGEIFRTYIERCLVPTLTPGDIVIMDNLPAHKVAGVRDAIAAIGAVLLYLPPYSPDFNPIEMLFAKLKALLRKAAERTIPSLWDAIGRLLDDLCRRMLALPRPCRILLDLTVKAGPALARKLLMNPMCSFPAKRARDACAEI
jgi:transposase